MTQSIRILGLDPGLRRTGWGLVTCTGNKLTHIANGVVTSKDKAPLADRLLELHQGLSHVVHTHAPHCAAVEQTFVNKDGAATLKLGQARAISLLVPALAGLEVVEYAPNLVKKSVVGVGHADKEQIASMVRVLLANCEINGADAADALAIAICHAHHRTSALMQRRAAS